jgi:hypothetical protein
MKDINRKLEGVLFSCGFRECIKNKSVNYLKISDNDFLVFRTFGGHTADLLHEKYISGENPCTSEPISDKLIVRDFDYKNDANILKEYIEELKAELTRL